MSPDIRRIVTNQVYDDDKQQNETKLNKEDNDGTPVLAKNIGTDYDFKRKLFWPNIVGFIFLHSMAVWGFSLIITGQVSWRTMVWTLFVMYMAAEGVTIGAHRLYTHKSFKASPLLRAVLLILQTVAGQNCMYIWVRDHRQHHRYSDTDADPHNSKRGFFFSHMGWLMSRKHPMVFKMGKTIDMSDLEADWMVMFQKKYYKTLYLVFAIFLPVAIPVYYFGESWRDSLLVAYFFRYMFGLNGTWLVNSAAHLYGTRPYDKNLQPVESWFVSLISSGEGWHNYHHAYPWDYRAAELGMHFNMSATYIEWFEKIGLASDLKAVPHDLVLEKLNSDSIVKKRILRTGDSSHYELGTDEGRAGVTTAGGVLLHPLNPTYTSTRRDPPVLHDAVGLPLQQEEDPQTHGDVVEPMRRARLLRPAE